MIYRRRYKLQSPPLMTCRVLAFAHQASSVIQRHWVEAESDTAGEEDSATDSHQVEPSRTWSPLILSVLLPQATTLDEKVPLLESLLPQAELYRMNRTPFLFTAHVFLFCYK